MTAAERRAVVLDELAARTFDVVVVGAGIIGCRVALDAARAGLSVALVDRGDIASGTSSASSKFIHGGFRYLAMGRLRLVRAAQLERARLLRLLPALARPMPMIVALEKRRYPRPVVELGLTAYRRLGRAGSSDARLLAPAEASALVRPLSVPPGAVLALLPEAQTDDVRLTLATARAAAEHGALVANYVGVEAFDVVGGRAARAFVRDRLGGSEFAIRCRSVVNASGAHVDAIRRLEDPSCRPLTTLSKGIHLVFPLDEPWRAGVAAYSDDHRTTFAVPWQGMLLVGTTDTPFFGDPEAARVEPHDEEGLLEAAGRLLPAELLRRDRIRFRFAGLRVLRAGAGDTARASREHIVGVGPGRIVSVAGGKLTLHRLIARQALLRLPAEVRPRVARAPAFPAVTDKAAQGLRAQIEHAIEHEWAVTVDDLVRRRTHLALQARDDESTRAELATLLRAAGYIVAAAELCGRGAQPLHRKAEPRKVVMPA
jgi:glycerol-3-phosphate dehydrogenase